jgi:hypothetical protein
MVIGGVPKLFNFFLFSSAKNEHLLSDTKVGRNPSTRGISLSFSNQKVFRMNSRCH